MEKGCDTPFHITINAATLAHIILTTAHDAKIVNANLLAVPLSLLLLILVREWTVAHLVKYLNS